MQFNTYDAALAYFQQENKKITKGYLTLSAAPPWVVERHKEKKIEVPKPFKPKVYGTSANGIMDTMRATINPVDGKIYDSRSVYNRAVKASGCEIVGNDMKTPTKPREIRGDFNVRKELKQAVHKVLG